MTAKSQECAAIIIQAHWRGHRIRKCILQTRFEYEEIAQEIRNEAGLGNEVESEINEVRWPCEKNICYPVHQIVSNKEVVGNECVDNELIINISSDQIHCDDDVDGECTAVNTDAVSDGNSVCVSKNNTKETSHVEQQNKLSSKKIINSDIIRSSSPISPSFKEKEKEEEGICVNKDSKQIVSNLHSIQTGGLLTESWMSDKSFDDTLSTSSNAVNNNNNNCTDNNPGKANITKADLVCKQKELMLELIWLQQAIHSRKVYLQLKRKSS